MTFRKDYVALEWLSAEIGETLKHARRALEEFVAEDSVDYALLDECAECVHQVRASLQFAQAPGAELIARELQAVLSELQKDKNAHTARHYEVLMGGLLRLPIYLDQVRSSRSEVTGMLKSTVNELRRVQGLGDVEETELFAPILSSVAPSGTPAKHLPAEQFAVSIRKLRQLFQRAFIDIIKNKKWSNNLRVLAKVTQNLKEMSVGRKREPFWLVGLAVMEGLVNRSIPPSDGVKLLLKEIDLQLKGLASHGPSDFDLAVPEQQMRSLLYLVARSGSKSPLINQVVDQYELEAALRDVENQEQTSGIDSEAERTAIEGLIEEIASIKDALDIFVRTEGASSHGLAGAAKQYDLVASTVSMLTLDLDASEFVAQQAVMDSIAAHPSQDNFAQLESVAHAVVGLEERLKHIYDAIPISTVSTLGPEVGQAKTDVIVQARQALEHSKDSIVDFIDGFESSRLEPFVHSLSQVVGALRMIDLDEPADLLERVSALVQNYLINRKQTLDQLGVECLAQVVVSVDYYLELITVDRRNADKQLMADTSALITTLESWLSEQYTTEDVTESDIAPKDDAEVGGDSATHNVVQIPSLIETAKQADESIVDDDIREIFIEEAEEVLGSIRFALPMWVADHDNHSALIDVRRAFHTLKGSGRTVGAAQLGDVAWTVEQVLNRIIDGSIPVTDARVDFVTQISASIMLFVDAFRCGEVVEQEKIDMVLHVGEELLKPEADDTVSSDLTLVWDAEDSVVDASTMFGSVDDGTADEATAEALGNLAHIEAVVAASYQEGNEVAIDDVFIRSLHTLKGLLNILQKGVLAGLLTQAESLVKYVNATNRHLVSEDLSLINALTILLRADLENNQRDHSVLPDPLSTALSERLDSYKAYDEDIYGEPLEDITNKYLILASDQASIIATTIDKWANGAITEAEQAGSLSAFSQIIDGAHSIHFSELEDIALAWQNAALNQGDMDILPESVRRLFDEAYEAILTCLDARAAGASVSPANIEFIAALNALAAQPHLSSDVSETIKGTEAEPLDGSDESLDELAEAVLATLGDDQDSPEASNEPSELSDETFDTGDRPDLEPLSDEPLLSYSDDVVDQNTDDTVDTFRDMGKTTDDVLPNGDETILEVDAASSVNDTVEEELPAGIVDTESAFGAEETGGITGIEEQPDTAIITEATAPTAEQANNYSQMSDEDFDAETLAIFREETTDLLEAMDNMLHEQGNRPDDEIVQELLRNLHTIKGGARLAGEFEIGDFTHDFETYLEQANRDSSGLSSEQYTHIHQLQDKLVQIFSGDDAAMAVEETTAEVSGAASVDADITIELDSSAVAEPVVDEVIDGGPEETPLVISAEPLPAEIVNTTDTDVKSVTLETRAQSQELVRVSGKLLENLVNLAGESSISRSRVEEQINEITFFVDELDGTLVRLQEQLRRLEIENEAQVLFRQEQVESLGLQEFDPLEMDRYSALQQLTRSLSESAFDVSDIKSTIFEKVRDIETLLVQQGRVNTDLQEGLMRTTMVPFDRIVPRLRRIVRQVSRDVGKSVLLSLDEAEGNLDRNVLETILPPLEHMLRNAIDHGIETSSERQAKGKAEHGQLRLSVKRDGADIVIKLGDDGRGVDFSRVREAAITQGLLQAEDEFDDRSLGRILMMPGFSTAEEVTQISGRGVGLDVVSSEISKLGGSIVLDSKTDIGTDFTIRLPFTASVNRALIVSSGTEQYALPLTTIDNVVRMPVAELDQYIGPNAKAYRHRGIDYELHNISELVDYRVRSVSVDNQAYVPVILMTGLDNPLAVQVDSVLGSREVVVKSLGPQFKAVPGIAGATIMGDGSVIVILDLVNLFRSSVQKRIEGEAVKIRSARQEESEKPLVMVVDDSVTVRKVASRFLERNGMRVLVAKDGVEAMQLLLDAKPVVMLLDVEMPRMDGFEVANRVKRTQEYSDITIVMITSRTGEKHRERALELGVEYYLGKPYQEKELLDILDATILTKATQ